MSRIDDELNDFGGVALAFAAACPQPSAEQVEEWAARHPDEAGEIRAYARIMLENPERAVVEDDAAADAMVARALGHATARLGARPSATLPELLAARGTTVRKVAEAVGIDRDVLADIVAGRLQPPIGRKLVAALSAAIGTAGQAVRDAVSASFDAPRLGHASSAEPAAQQPRTWEQSIAASVMPDDRKAFWLADD